MVTRAKFRIAAWFAASLLLAGCGVMGVGQGKGEAKSTGPAPATLKAASGDSSTIVLETCRPRLFFRPMTWAGGQSVEQLRQRAATEPFSEEVKTLQTTRANLAMRWLITGDGAAAREAVEKMKASQYKNITSNDGWDLIDVALAYDWLHAWPGFTADEKKQVEGIMLSAAEEMRGSLIHSAAHVYHTRMYAWVAAVGVVGLTLHDIDAKGRDLFLFARDYYEKRLIPAQRFERGGLHSGFTYMPNCMLLPLLEFLKASKSASDVDFFHTADPADSDWLRDLPEFLVNAIQPDMTCPNYADVAVSTPEGNLRFVLDILAAEYRDGHAAELARRISAKYQTTGYNPEWKYLMFAFQDATVKPKPFGDLPTSRVFSKDGVGHVFMRSGWSEKATEVHFICGDYFDDHGHFAQGSFTIFKKGLLALKGGAYIGFNTDHRNRYFKQAISANTVIFNDPSDPKDEGRQRNMKYQDANTLADYMAHKKSTANPCVETGDILAVDDTQWISSTSQDLHSVVADVTAAWDSEKVKRYGRSLAFVDGKHLVVVDETETVSAAIRARWLLHTQVEPKRLSPSGQVWEVSLPESVLFVQTVLAGAAAQVDEPPPKVTLIGGPGHECDVNGVNYTYVQPRERTIKGGMVVKPMLNGLWPPPITSVWRAATLGAIDPNTGTMADGNRIIPARRPPAVRDRVDHRRRG